MPASAPAASAPAASDQPGKALRPVGAADFDARIATELAALPGILAVTPRRLFSIWLAVTAAGGIVATLKMFFIIGLIAMAVFIIVWLVARRPRRG
jgi:hypothetical protein